MLARFLSGASAAVSGLQFVGGRTYAEDEPLTVPLTSLTGGIATSPSAGDIVIVAVGFKNSTDRDIKADLAGYTEVADLFAGGVNNAHMAVFYKVLSSAETSVDIDLDGHDEGWAVVHVWRGVNQTTPLDAITSTNTGIPGVPNCPAITTITDGAVVIAIGGAVYGLSPSNGVALTTPTGMTNFYTIAELGIFGIGIASILRETAGFYDPPAFGGGSTNTNNSYCAVTLALRPA